MSFDPLDFFRALAAAVRTKQPKLGQTIRFIAPTFRGSSLLVYKVRRQDLVFRKLSAAEAETLIQAEKAKADKLLKRGGRK